MATNPKRDLVSPNSWCTATENNEMTYFAVVQVTFPLTCAILAEMGVVSQTAKGLLFGVVLLRAKAFFLAKQMPDW